MKGEPARFAPPTLIPWAGLAFCDRGELEFGERASHRPHIEQPERVDRRIVEWLEAGQ